MHAEKRNTCKVSVRNPEGRRPLGRGLEDNKKQHGAVGQGPVAGCCEHGNESSGSIKCYEIL
jgi:hypothetical protein